MAMFNSFLFIYQRVFGYWSPELQWIFPSTKPAIPGEDDVMNGNLLEDKSQRTFFWSKSKHVRWLKSFQCQFWIVKMCESQHFHDWNRIQIIQIIQITDLWSSSISNIRVFSFLATLRLFEVREAYTAFTTEAHLGWISAACLPWRDHWRYKPGLCKAYLGGYIIHIINNIYIIYIYIIYIIYTLYIHYIYIYIIATKDGFIWYSTSRLGTWNGNWKMDCLSLKDLKGYISPNKIGISHTNLEGFAYIVPCWNGTGDQSGKFTAFWQQTLTAKLHPPLSCCDAI